MKVKAFLSIGAAVILLATLLIYVITSKKQFGVPFKQYSEIEITYAQITCLKKRIEISEEELKNIIDNFCYKRHNWVTNQIDVNILIFIKGQIYPLAITLTESGWNYNIVGGDIFEFKDKDLGKKQYYDLWNRATKSTTFPEPKRFNNYKSLLK